MEAIKDKKETTLFNEKIFDIIVNELINNKENKINQNLINFYLFTFSEYSSILIFLY